MPSSRPPAPPPIAACPSLFRCSLCGSQASRLANEMMAIWLNYQLRHQGQANRHLATRRQRWPALSAGPSYAPPLLSRLRWKPRQADMPFQPPRTPQLLPPAPDGERRRVIGKEGSPNPHRLADPQRRSPIRPGPLQRRAWLPSPPAAPRDERPLSSLGLSIRPPYSATLTEKNTHSALHSSTTTISYPRKKKKVFSPVSHHLLPLPLAATFALPQLDAWPTGV